LKKKIEICVRQGSNRGPLVQSGFYKKEKRKNNKISAQGIKQGISDFIK